MTDELEGDKYITLHFVQTSFIEIPDLLAKTAQEAIEELDGIVSVVAKMKGAGRAYVTKNLKDMTPTFEHRALTFLMPNYKKLFFLDYRDRHKLHCEVEDYIEQNYPENHVETVENIPTTSSNRFVSFDSESVNSTEIERYINHPITSEVDAVSWWCANGKSYPTLYRLFKQLSCIPATSASSEREFSLAGNTITDKRSMLLPDNVNDLIVARNNI